MKWYLCQKFNLKLKFHKKLVEKFEQFVVLFTGFFGLQNGIFGKFYWFFSFANVWKRLNTCRFYGAARWSVCIHNTALSLWSNILQPQPPSSYFFSYLKSHESSLSSSWCFLVLPIFSGLLKWIRKQILVLLIAGAAIVKIHN